MITNITDSYYCCSSAFLLPNWTIKVLMTSPVLCTIHQLHEDWDLWHLTHSSLATCLHLSLHPFPFSLPCHPSNLFLLILPFMLTPFLWPFQLTGSHHLCISPFPPGPCILRLSLAPHSTTSFSASHTHCHDLYLLASSPSLLFVQKIVTFPSLPSFSHTKHY